MPHDCVSLPAVSPAGGLRAFAKTLCQLVGEAEGMRPLLCDGNPLTCTVALVGANPGTKTPFQKFWSDEQGMNRAGWIAEYLLLHGGKFGRSRAAIERFVPQVRARVIELNAYSLQSKRLSNLARHARNADVLAFVLSAVRPRVIVCAGAVPLRTLRVMNLSWSPVVLEARHFIYWGMDSERRLAGRINEALHSLVR